MTKVVKKTVLDNEWINLMKEAKTIGLTVEEIRLFLIQVQKSD
ncbi:anti-repressor SinI family protein [Virgibacillus ndiopensis]|nr:anti-repressor SinI family protein [Virgibacillus ndiopensis]